MKKKSLFLFFTIMFCFNISFSIAHKLPSHFADHNHESDPEFKRPYIRVKNKN